MCFGSSGSTYTPTYTPSTYYNYGGGDLYSPGFSMTLGDTSFRDIAPSYDYYTPSYTPSYSSYYGGGSSGGSGSGSQSYSSGSSVGQPRQVIYPSQQTSGLADFATAVGKAAVPLAVASYLGSKSQSDMISGLNQAQQESYDQTTQATQESYDKYLEAINPPEEVKQTQFNQLKSQALASAPLVTQRISNELAARGIRGQGLATPLAENERDLQNTINDAYYQIFGTYNVPSSMMPVSEYPVTYTPSTSTLLGQNVADYSTLLAMMDLYR